MEKDKLIEIAKDPKNKSNKDLFLVVNELHEEFEKTKKLIVDLTRHLETVEILYNEKRIKK
jgi:hypothetical protein